MRTSNAIPYISLFCHQETHTVIFTFFSCTMHYTFWRLFLHWPLMFSLLFNRSQSKGSVVNQMSHLFFRAQKYLLAVFNFLKMVIFTTLFRRWSALSNSMLKICKFERWHTQRCFNIDLTLSNVATSYHPNKNVETTLKGILRIDQYC